MTQTQTNIETWSRIHARVVGGKVVADLRQMRQEYGSPTEARLDDYLSELVVLLADRLLAEVTYGFVKDGRWIVGVRYVADMNGNLTADDRSGGIPRGMNISGATWRSFLSYSDRWFKLPSNERLAVSKQLPFQRGTGTEPGCDVALGPIDKVYSNHGCGLSRSTIGATR